MSEVPVRVAVRVRPLVGQEKVHNVPRCVEFVPNKPQLILGRDRGFTFDYVFHPDSTQAEVYETCVEPLVRSCLEGYNATIFAYGQTGSGKTFTVGGVDTGGILEEQYGVIPRAIKQIFQAFEENKHKIMFEVHVSYMEIYLEELRDLLDLDSSNKDIHIREDEKGHTVVMGVMEQYVESLDEVMSCLDSGSASRHTGATNMNEYSSRSHAIFTLYIGQKPLTDQEQVPSAQSLTRKASQESEIDYTEYKYSKFHFVDLAGSERANRTGNVGDRFKESVQINTGLLALGNVISALADPRKKTLHVPYRESKITRLLKDSLGGNARTVMITCLSPAAADFAENLNTLKFATRARNIRNKPVINRDPQNAKLAEMQNQIMALREELHRRRGSSISGVTTDTNDQVKVLEDELHKCRSFCERYAQCVSEASALLKSLHKADVMSNNQSNEYEQWAKSVEQIRMRPIWTPNTSRQQQHEIIDQLTKENQKLKSDLASDEEIFADKAKEIDALKDSIRTLEEDNKAFVQQLDHCMMRIRRQEDQLFQQQLQLNQQHNGIATSRSKLGLIAETRTRAQTAPTDATTDPKADQRNLHSSPSVLTSDRIIQGFRARSQLLVSKCEERDEVLCSVSDSSDSEDEKAGPDTSRQLGKTWKVKTNGVLRSNIPSVNGDKKTRPRRDKERKGSDAKRSEKEEDMLESLRTSTRLMDKEVKEAELGLHEAQQKLRELTINIKMKEEFIKELVKSDKEAKDMKKQYTEKVKGMRQEIEKAKRDLETTKKTLEGYENKANYEQSEKQKLESDYKRKVQAMESKISALKRKQKDSEKVNALHEEREKKVQDLVTQMERMRAQQDQLTKRLRDEMDRKGRLERDMQKQLQRVKELEEQTSQQQKILKRKTEEVAKVQRKLRNVGKQGSDDNAGEQQAKLEERRQWLDTEVEKVVQRKQAIEALEEELTKREQIVQTREAMVAEKSGLEIKKLRSSQVLTKDIFRLSTQVNEVEMQIQEKGVNYKRSQTGTGKEQLKDELHSLNHNKDELRKQRELLEQKLQQGALLEPTEERRLIELDEGIEVLEAAIEFKDEQIANQQQELEENEDFGHTPDSVKARLKALPHEQATSLLGRYFSKVVQLREEERKLRLESEDLKVRLDEQERIIGELGRSLQQAKLQADRKSISQQKEGEERIQFLISKLKDAEAAGADGNHRDVDQQVQQLQQDLYYYKKTCRDLKKKLRERMSDMAESAESGIAGGGRVADSGDQEPAKHLSAEMARVKQALQGVAGNSQTHTPVRLSRKGLRQLSAEELQQRASLTTPGSVQTSVAPERPVTQSIPEETGNDTLQDSIEQGANPWK